MTWEIVFTKQAQKDAKKLASAGLKGKAQKLLEVIREDPFQNPPSYEKLIGDLSGAYSRRINIQHRLVYQVYQQERIIKVLRLWTHYE
ncbi:Txe/YoeB family addiction module toxin [Desulfopila aestuarii]|uniref:Putative mRNA interferase YoeB n=1 Tax=Desulfopila aestuarii DSM 18488 TaxID=1121416 RepID=A0A1M7YGD1_9BACT|nr:Txe/YoeB family addiction module toxin [Desulfopila aestuarii]SHO51578.1 toxin-antitoxin system, toxin component, Txe/YoeB family [Desulfopila aestuarii DSM 18488]